jgi:hypothetical protein
LSKIINFSIFSLKHDNHSGIIDSWPAHSANQHPLNMQIALAKNNTLIIYNAQAEGKPDLTPKPKFLENLEKFLQKELKKLGATNGSIASEAKLQVGKINSVIKQSRKTLKEYY